MKKIVILLLFLAGGFCCWGEPPGEGEHVAIGQPTIFWHNGEWQTYKDGVWTPYFRSADHSSQSTDPAASSQAASRERGNYVTSGNWVTVTSPGAATKHGGDFRDKHLRPGESVTPNNRPDIGIGQTTIGIGKRTIGIGQTTIGIGQPNTSIGRTTIGIGQPNSSIGPTTIGIGQPNTGIGQTTIGIGHPNTGIGERNGIGQTTIGIGRPNPGMGEQTESNRKPNSR